MGALLLLQRVLHNGLGVMGVGVAVIAGCAHADTMPSNDYASFKSMPHAQTHVSHNDYVYSSNIRLVLDTTFTNPLSDTYAHVVCARTLLVVCGVRLSS